jgi:eukaryotic translation initiation factor 2C
VVVIPFFGTCLTRQDLPKRPSYGKEGRPVNIFANHYRITNIPSMKIYQYALVVPTKDGGAPTKGLAGAVWESPEFKEALGSHYPALIFNGMYSLFTTYTGRSVAWSTERIHNIPAIEIPRGKSSIKVTFNYATEFALADLSAYIKKQKANSPEIFQCLTFLNQVIANSFTKESSRFMAVGRKYFPLDDDERDISRVDDWSLLEFRKGFYQAVHWGGTAGLTVNVNVTTGIFWNSQLHTIVELALRTIGKAATDGIALSALNENQFRMIARNVRGIKFYIKYRGAQKEKQLHMVTNLSKESARGKKFELQGKTISVADYFQATYNVRLRYPDAPLVKKGENFFPMEMCWLVPVYSL